MKTESGKNPLQPVIDQIDQLLRQRRTGEADRLCREFTRLHPQLIEAWLLAARASQQQQKFQDMLTQVNRALSLSARNPTAVLMKAEALMHNGQMSVARGLLADLEKIAAKHPVLWPQIAGLYSQAGQHDEARRCYLEAVWGNPRDPVALYNLASVEIALGNLDEADRLLSDVIAINPQDYDAYYNRATLRRQSANNNHIDELVHALDSHVRHPGGEVPICYALAKELEDVGDYDRAFDYLKRGADARKAGLSYKVDDDVATIDAIIEHFGAGLFDRKEGFNSDAPIFVLGLPRSGTTLVDRILASHDRVDSLGEINDFVMALMSQLGGGGDKQSLIARSAGIDFAALGSAYCKSTAAYGNSGPHLIDKTPVNFLYLGLIALALPGARVIHVRRNPMDSCFAIYKTLFRMAYPFSYDLEDIGRYYLAYHRLMAHWRQVLPGRFMDIDYEALVADQEGVSRRLLDYCGLDWQDEVLRFHEKKSAAATASAAQVRQPIYRSSVDKWRRYESRLEPLAEILRSGGVIAE